MSAPNPTTSAHYCETAGALYAAHRQADPLHVGYRLNLEYFLPYLKPTDAVLDFGCGNGGMLRLLGEHVRNAEGLEVNPHAAEVARGFGYTVHSALEGLARSPVYDVIVSNHVLEHVRDVPTTLERLRECLTPGGFCS